VVFASAYHAGFLTSRRRRKPWKSRGFEAITGNFPPTQLGEEPDLMVFEKMRRFAEEEQVGIVFAGASLSPGEKAVLHEVWPDLVEHQHAGQDRKIKQVALIFVDGYCGRGTLVTPEGRLITSPLEEAGLGVVFVPTKDIAVKIYRVVSRNEPSLRLVQESDICSEFKGTLINTGEVKTFLTYSRGVLGSGTNLLGVRFLVVYANAFRYIGGFTPGEITAEAFEKARADEVANLIAQNVGRALRGEPNKTTAIFVLNAEGPVIESLAASPAILEGSELPPVIINSEDIPTLVDQARRWLAAGGGEWPAPDPTRNKRSRKGGRPKDSRAKREARVKKVLERAEAAIQAGTPWRIFLAKVSPQRTLSEGELRQLQERFKK